MSPAAKSPVKQVLIFDNPRNRSHLFFRLLATHPEFKTHYHPYMNAASLGPERVLREKVLANEERAKLAKEFWEPMCSDEFTFAEAQRGVVQAVSDSKKGGEMLLVNEHCCYVTKREILISHIKSREFDFSNPAALPSNPTQFPDDLWNNACPIMVIRHPALAVPSLYRSLADSPTMVNLDPTENAVFYLSTLAWSRFIFEKLQSQGRTPLVVDGEDICTRTGEVIQGVCDYLGLDASRMSDTWTPWGQTLNHAHPLFVEMTRVMWESDGVKKHAVSYLICFRTHQRRNANQHTTAKDYQY